MKNRWVWISLVALFACVYFIITPMLIHSSPEFSQVTLLMKNNPALTETFGSVQGFDLDDINNEVNWSAQGLFGKGSYTGTYQFKVTGAKRSGVILVNWTSTAEHQAHLVSINEVTTTGGYLSTIWKGPLGQAPENSLPAESLSTNAQAAPRVTVIDVCIYFFSGVLVLSLAGVLVYFFSRTPRKTTISNK